MFMGEYRIQAYRQSDNGCAMHINHSHRLLICVIGDVNDRMLCFVVFVDLTAKQ